MIANRMIEFLRQEAEYYGSAEGQLDDVPFQNVSRICRVMADRLEALSPSRLSANDEGVTALELRGAVGRLLQFALDDTGEVELDREDALRVASALSPSHLSANDEGVTDEMVERAARAIAGTAWEGIYSTTKSREQYIEAEWRNHATDARTALAAAIPTKPEAVKGEPDFAATIQSVIAEESSDGAACGWQSCTGCHETNEGYETGRYPYSEMFGCNVGAGCSECGGLGVVWEYWTKDALDDMARDITQPPTPASAELEVVAYGYDAQALKGAAEFFEGMATGSDPAPLAFAQAIRRALSTSREHLAAITKAYGILSAGGPPYSARECQASYALSMTLGADVVANPSVHTIEGNIEVVAHAYVIDGDCEQLEWGVEYDLPDDPALVKLVTLDTASGWKAACMEAREGCNQRSDTIRSLRRHLDAAEARIATLEKALDAIENVDLDIDINLTDSRNAFRETVEAYRNFIRHTRAALADQGAQK